MTYGFTTEYMSPILVILTVILGSHVNSQTCDIQKIRADLLSETRPCRLPSDDQNRRFCPVSCKECYERGSHCHWAPGSQVSPHTRVQCSQGHRLDTDQDYDVLACDNGTWIGEFPQCLAQCPPLVSDSVFPKCLSGSREVDCSKPMMPKTTATIQCRPSHTEYPNLVEAGIYKRTMSCRYTGQWSHNLPECKPVCGVSKGSTIVTATVVDGKDTPLGVFPWHAALYKREDKAKWKYICGGSLITNRVVLTAAHCVILDKNDLRLAFAKYYRVWDQELDEPYTVKREVSAISLPQEFDWSVNTLAWDIALVFLDQPVQVNSYIMPVCRSPLLTIDHDKTSKGFVVGWGQTGSGKDSDVLQHNDISIMPHDMCNRKIPRALAVDKFCGSKNSASVVAKGDSGGGLTAEFNGQHHLLGIVSIKYGDISIFTNTSWTLHTNWVENQIINFDEEITRCSGYTFQCGLYGACLERSVRCNGRRDCTDGSDEFDCPVNLNRPDMDNEQKMCKLPAQPANGRYQSLQCAHGDRRTVCLGTPGTSVPAFWLLEYSCQIGHAVNSTHSMRTTCEDGAWTNPLQCVKQCPGLDAAFVDLSCEFGGDGVSCREPVRAGTTAVATCKTGYIRPSGDAPIRMECLSNGRWSLTVENCTPDPGQNGDGNNGITHGENKTDVVDRLPFYLGDVCKVQGSVIWRCQFFKKCPTAIAELKSGKKPAICNFDSSSMLPIVCCEMSGQYPTPTRKPEIAGKPSDTGSEEHSTDIPESNEGEPGEPIKEEVQPQAIGTISKQKCNEYAEHVLIRFPNLTLPNEILTIDSCGAVEPLITNGVNAQPREYPHMALIGFGRKSSIQWQCAGSLISERFVLTLGRCVDGNSRMGPPRWVRLGEYNIKSDNDEKLGLSQPVDYEISKTMVHPEYVPLSQYNDIGLVKLSKDVEFNEYIRPACLYTSQVLIKTYAVATGWGSTEFRGKPSDILLKVNLTIIPYTTCDSMWPTVGQMYESLKDGIVDAQMICAGGTDFGNGKDTCQGDSGAPLQLRLKAPYCMYSIIGLASFGYKCGGKTPSIYTRVSYYVPWIEAVVWPTLGFS